MYKTVQILVKPKKNKDLCDYFRSMCMTYTYLKNTANFHIRQHMTGLGLSEDKLHPNQKESLDLVKHYIPVMIQKSIDYCEKRKKNILNSDLSDEEKSEKISSLKPVDYSFPTAEKWYLGYNILDGVLKLSKNENYISLPAQVNQQAIRDVCESWKGYFKASNAYDTNPSRFTGKPKLPKYLKNPSVISFTNINCSFIKRDRNIWLKFPKTDAMLNLGHFKYDKLAEVKAVPYCDGFMVNVVCKVPDIKQSETEIMPQRGISIDLGKRNLLTVTNNVGLKPILIKGVFICKRNTQYLKMAAYAQTKLRTGLDSKDYTKPFTSLKMKRIYKKRDRFLKDVFYKIGHYIVRYCKKNKIDTVIIGHNKGMKQNINLGTKNNKDFYYIPFTMLYNILSRLCYENCINYVETEESFTSQASFFDRDIMPTYNENVYSASVIQFSGKRNSRLYRTNSGYVINADVNGSLNIMRKVYPELTENIKINDVAKCNIVNYDTFFPSITKNQRTHKVA